MRWPLVGREAELRVVSATLSEGSTGGLVVAGPAGVGKTRLALEASELAAAEGCAVTWVRATRSAASIPLGAFGALLPPADTPLPGGVELLARVRHALAERAAGRRLVLCVDDGQLLDDVSAALVHQLVAAREAFAIVTVRRATRSPTRCGRCGRTSCASPCRCTSSRARTSRGCWARDWADPPTGRP